MLVYDIVHKIGNEESQGLYQYKAMILDSVHGFIPINAGEYWILQTPFMRRLHNIKQLGANYLVFPSAKHTRLQHSLGSMHIASRMANKILNYALSEHNSKLCAALFAT
jgi:HD superfamily phosphohydrolase